MNRPMMMLTAILALAPMAIATRSMASAGQHGAAAGESPAPAAPKAEMRQQMMAKMHAPDAELEHLVAAMNAATGDAKVAAMADVLTRMIQRQTAMREDMQQSMKTMMAQCPMMKDAAAHEHEHQP